MTDAIMTKRFRQIGLFGALMALATRPEAAPNILTRPVATTHRLHLTKHRPTRAQRKTMRRMQKISRRINRP
ncbi:MAG: hypothetical protein NUV51_00640 [Sulfuricaulis sp.]|nr:hypothetical protein [Sulfuricaulis sp.]